MRLPWDSPSRRLPTPIRFARVAAMEPPPFSPLNYAILAAYLAGMIGIGLLFARRQKNTEDFFLGGRKMPWLAVGMSMYASLTSAVTFMALPGTAYRENISFIVVSFASLAVAPVLVSLFYPFYRRIHATTSYEYVHRRFGPRARSAAAGLFVLARLGWLGLVIYAPSLALSVAAGIPLHLCILAMGALATLYTVLGGMAAVIWTDVVQFVLMLGGIAWLAFALSARAPGGALGILRFAGEHGHLRIADSALSLTAMSGWIVGLGYFFQLMQDYGTDQTTVQRMMAIPTARGTTRAIFFNAGVDFVVIGALLFIGLGLFACQAADPTLLPEGLAPDRLLPAFIVRGLPNGVSGLLIAALFAAAMSSMDSGINCVATVLVHDFVRPARNAPASDASDLRLARLLTLVLGAFATLLAFYVSRFDQIIQAYSTIVSLFNAPILGLFLLGMLTRRATFAGWAVGAAIAVAATQAVQAYTPLHYAYYFPLSLLLTLVLGYAASLRPKLPPSPQLTIWK
jgi:solute:Na+ symporter, SSS family